MKKLTFTFALLSALFACKKEASTPNNSGNNTTDTTKTSNQFIGKLGPNITDVDGNSYKTVTIGAQTWMAENLKTSKYNDGTQIPNVTDYTNWSQLTTGAWAYYNNDSANYAKFGKLYNWYAVNYETNGNKNVCPTGWHVPTDEEWTILTDYLGGESVAGGKMKEAGNINWGGINNINQDSTNKSLFTGLPGGDATSILIMTKLVTTVTGGVLQSLGHATYTSIIAMFTDIKTLNLVACLLGVLGINEVINYE